MTDRNSTLSTCNTPSFDPATVLEIRDELCHVFAAHHFFGDAVHTLMHTTRDVDIAPETLHGCCTVLDWLREHDQRIMVMLDQCLKRDGQAS